MIPSRLSTLFTLISHKMHVLRDGALVCWMPVCTYIGDAAFADVLYLGRLFVLNEFPFAFCALWGEFCEGTHDYSDGMPRALEEWCTEEGTGRRWCCLFGRGRIRKNHNFVIRFLSCLGGPVFRLLCKLVERHMLMQEWNMSIDDSAYYNMYIEIVCPWCQLYLCTKGGTNDKNHWRWWIGSLDWRHMGQVGYHILSPLMHSLRPPWSEWGVGLSDLEAYGWRRWRRCREDASQGNVHLRLVRHSLSRTFPLNWVLWSLQLIGVFRTCTFSIDGNVS